jgi:predicted O-linked N-acetylglucosamine transferase (SPINDLY family)
LRKAPQDATALANLGTVLVDSGDCVEARRALTAAVATAPDDLHALSLLAHCDAHLCRFDDFARAHATIASRLASDPGCGINPFHALAMPLSAAALRQSARHWAASFRPESGLPPAIVRERGNRLRLGYVSSNLREHAIAYLATEVWERHDAARLATFAYAIGPSDRAPAKAPVTDKGLQRCRPLLFSGPRYDSNPVRSGQLWGAGGGVRSGAAGGSVAAIAVTA